MVDEIDEIKNEKIVKIIAELKNRYYSEDAQEEIDRAVETIMYHEKRGEDEKALNHAKALEDFLYDWY